MTSILVVDDQDLVRAGLASLLRAAPAGYDVVEASNAEQAVELAATRRPEVILMDIRMPGTDGITAIRMILADAVEPAPRILVLTTFDLDEYVHSALRAGASGFLLKSTPADRLFAAVEAALAGDLPFTPAITRRLIETYTASHSPATANPKATAAVVETLTGRELDVLRLVAGGLSNTDIADQLAVAESTVKKHLYRAMNKLGLVSRAQAVAYAYEVGIITAQHPA